MIKKLIIFTTILFYSYSSQNVKEDEISNIKFIEKEKKYNSIHEAILAQDIEAARKLITDKNINELLPVKLEDYDTTATPLMLAAETGNYVFAKELISKGAHINGQNKLGTTPIMFAAIGNHLSTVKTLIESGADINKPNYDGF